jgi:hypothetical protein
MTANLRLFTRVALVSVAVSIAFGQKTKPAQTGTVAYADLKAKKVSVPYGTPFTITGELKDVQLTGGALTDLLAVQTVAGDYTTSDGNKGTIASSAVKGTSWQVDIGKLTADTSVTFNFQFTGLLSPTLQNTVVSAMLGDPAYKAATTHFVSSAEGKAATAQVAAMTLLAQSAADVVTAVLNKDGLTPKSPADLKTSLNTALLANIEPTFNVSEQFPELVNPAYKISDLVGMSAADFAKLTALEMYQKLKGITDYSKAPAGLQAGDKASVDRFIQSYDSVAGGIAAGTKSAQFLVTSTIAVGNDQQSALVDDLKKYAGFDVGALYGYRLNDLRSYAMVNIYLGPVSLKPDAPYPSAKRLSLAFGMALKDLSGASSSKISGENAFVYGLGYRLNKYFRFTVGGLLYRTTLPAVNGSTSPANGSLRNELFFGPSIDVTALPALKSIFASSKSTN